MEPSSSPRSEEIYRAAVGEAKADYYVPKFLRFDEPGAARTSWNWPAFFITFFWLLYRRMYGYAFVYLLPLPIVLALSSLIVTALFGQTVGAIVYWAVVIVVQYVVIPMYANAIYHSHIRKRIATLESSAPSQDALVQRLIGYSAVSGAGAIIGIACFVGVAVIGILAAIAIPAYQDYTIRAQVSEGLTLAAPVKASVVDSYLSSTVWPADLEAAGLDAANLSGKYVKSIAVSDGVILIRYGNAANPAIAGRTLALYPVAVNRDVVRWGCGYNIFEGSNDDRGLTDVPAKHLPSGCRKAS